MRPSPPFSRPREVGATFLQVTLSVFLGAFLLGWLARSVFFPPPATLAGASPAANAKSAAAAGKEKSGLPKLKKPGAGSAADAPADAAAASGKGVPRSAREVMERLFSDAQGQEATGLDSFRYAGRFQQLKDFGDDGAKAILDFLRTQQDVNFGGSGMHGGRLTQYPSLRAGLLETLYDLDAPTAKEASLEVLRSSPSSLELLLATRNLEKSSPGTYREEAVKAVAEILGAAASASDAASQARVWDHQLMDMVGYYQARELMPQMEELVKKQPYQIQQWLGQLAKFPPEDLLASYGRLMEQDAIRKQVIQSPSLVTSQLDYRNEGSRQIAKNLLAVNLNAQQKEQLVMGISQAMHSGQSFMKADEGRRGYRPDKARMEAALQMLDEIATQMDTPQLKQRWEASRKQLQSQLRYAR